MNSLGSPFCEVCSEALVLAIYKFVAPVDAFTPSDTNLSISTTDSVQFNLSLLQPSTHALEVQWSTNGILVPGETSAAFTVSPQTLGNGTHLIRALVKDNTPLVRNDPNHLLNQNIEWTLNINLPDLQLDSVVMLPAGRFAFRVNGTAPQGFSIRGSSNLLDWTALITNSLVGGHFWYTNSNSFNFPSYFFRSVTPP
jgi:hypothetical protein